MSATPKAPKPTKSAKPKPPKVRLAMPSGRPIEVRYTCPTEKREIRISTGTRDPEAAQAQADAIKAKLLLGIEVTPRKVKMAAGPRMDWEEFRQEYTRLKVETFRSDQARGTAEVRLDLLESIINPRTLSDMAKPETLARLQAELLAGSGGKRGRQEKREPRSPHTVRSYMATLIAALNWAHRPMRWLPEGIEFDMLEVDDPDKGRPLCLEEFERMLASVAQALSPDDPAAVTVAAIESWRYLLRGLWDSGLRLGEALKVSWDIEGTIQPHFPKRGFPYMVIPAKLQKNRKAQEVPMTPAFVALLRETPAAERSGWVFNPTARRVTRTRLTRPQVGRIISLMGEKANVVVNAKGKSASAHDLRRSFGQRMADAGLPPRDLQAIMRHASFTTTEQYYLRDRVQDQATRIAQYLGTSPPEVTVEI